MTNITEKLGDMEGRIRKSHTHLIADSEGNGEG